MVAQEAACGVGGIVAARVGDRLEPFVAGRRWSLCVVRTDDDVEVRMRWTDTSGRVGFAKPHP
jgi:hypothetical protein